MILEAVLLLLLLISFWLMSRKRRFKLLESCNIPGPAPGLLLGNILEYKYSKNKLQVDVIAKWRNAYGSIFGYYFGLQPRIVVEDLKLMKLVLMKDYNNFITRPGFVKRFGSITDAKGQNWKDLRCLLSPVFKERQIEANMNTFCKSVDSFIEILEERCDSSQLQPFDVTQHMQALTMDIIFKTLLAVDVDCQRNWNHEMPTALRVLGRMPLYVIFILIRVIPSITSLVLLLSRFHELNASRMVLEEHLKRAIQERKVAEQRAESVPDDFLQVLLDTTRTNTRDSREKLPTSLANDDCEGDVQVEDEFAESRFSERKKMSQKLCLTEDQVRMNAITLMIAGYETASTTICFIVYALALYPDIQEKVHQEITSVFFEDFERPKPDEPSFTYDRLSKLIYTEQVALETLRLFPTVALFTTREAENEYKYKNITIPAGCAVQIPVHLLNRDPKFWKNPEQFDPDRFAPDCRRDINPLVFQPFGYGPRKCLGEKFAMTEIKVTIAKLLINFEILKSEKFQDPVELALPYIILHPKNGIWIRLQRRR